MDQKKLLKFILVAMVSGILIGWLFHSNLSTTQAENIASYFKILTDVFLRLIKMWLDLIKIRYPLLFIIKKTSKNIRLYDKSS